MNREFGVRWSVIVCGLVVFGCANTEEEAAQGGAEVATGGSSPADGATVGVAPGSGGIVGTPGTNAPEAGAAGSSHGGSGGAASVGGGGSMLGSKTDGTFLSFTDSDGVTSEYHRFAAGLDWERSVGLLIYTDGSAEFGLKNPESTYLLAGPEGMIAVAKSHNMVLLTPLAPGGGCGDGDGTCWYMKSSGHSPVDKARWSVALVKHIQSEYEIDRSRVAFGGYSSGAQWTTEYFGPLYASEVMDDGVAVAISYGGSPKVSPRFTPEFVAAVPFVWDVGEDDPAYEDSGVYGVVAGYEWYTEAGFETELRVLSKRGHDRWGEFGAVMDDAIERLVP